MLMFLRYLAAAPLLAASLVGVPVAYQTLFSFLFRRKSRGPEFDVGAEIAKAFVQDSVLWPCLIAVALLVVFWWMTTAWPKIALVPSVMAALNGLIFSLMDGWKHSLAGVATVPLAWGLAWLAGLIVTRPITGDVRRGAVEVAVGLRGGGRLRVQSRRLLLDKLPPPAHPLAPMGRLAIRFDRISHVEAGIVHSAAQWRLANSAELTLMPGPALRIIGAGQEWLLPVTETGTLLHLISERARVRATPDPRPPLDNGDWFHAKAWWERAGEEWPQRNEKKVNHGNRWASLIVAAITAPMAGYGLFQMFTEGWTYVFALLIFGGVALGATITWFNQGRVYKLNEENPVSPMAPNPDPRRIPVTGWHATPVVLGQTSDM